MADDELMQERLYTIPLRKLHKVSRSRRAPVAVRMVEDFITKHMKPERDGEVLRTSAEARKGSGEEKQLFIDPPVNQFIWSRGIEKPPSKVRVRALKFEDGSVIISADYPQTKQILENAGFTTKSVDMAHIRAADGSLTCCSIFYQ